LPTTVVSPSVGTIEPAATAANDFILGALVARTNCTAGVALAAALATILAAASDSDVLLTAEMPLLTWHISDGCAAERAD